jgi:hypothetical protein
MLWDVWLPIYTMLEMFGLTKEQLLVTRYPSASDAPQTNQALEMLFGFPHRTTPNELLSIPDSQSNYVCASHGASGFGWLTDHGVGSHGWDARDLEYPVNLRRGPELRRLRNYMLSNVGLPTETKLQAPFQITFSINSSRNQKRRIDFRDEIAAVMGGGLQLPNGTVTVSSSHVVSLPIMKQLEVAAKTAIYISAAGGGTVPAYFLPRGATLILYGDRDSYLDFDLFNNYGQVRVHWMSLTSRHNDTNILLALIRDELDTLTRSSSQQHNM